MNTLVIELIFKIINNLDINDSLNLMSLNNDFLNKLNKNIKDKIKYSKTIQSISLGPKQTALLNNNGTLKIFGNNTHAQCDLNDNNNRYISYSSLGGFFSGVL